MWEYKFEVMDLWTPMSGSKDADPLEEAEAQLNELGQQGWEVVALLPKMGKGETWTIALLKRESI